MVTTQQVSARLQEILSKVDLATTTERQIREQLARDLSIEDFAPYKPLVRQQINEYLQNAVPADDVDGEEEEEDEYEDDDDEPAPPKRRRTSDLPVGGSGPELSPELAAIVGHTHMKRTEVVKALWQYIKANDLQDPTNKQHIILDSKLATIFEPPVTQFSMNKQLSKHIAKSEGSSRAPKRSGATPGGKKYTGFNKLIVLSDDMAAWYGKPHASRGEVTKYFYAYIKEHNLKDPANKQYVLCDEKLQRLTGLKRFKAFGVNKFFNKHFLVDEEVVLGEEDEDDEDQGGGGAEDEAPTNAKEEAVAAKDEPSVVKEEPVAAKEEPSVAKEEPVAAKEPSVAEELVVAKEEPSVAKEEPVAAKEEPVAVKEELLAAKEEPVAAKEEPVAAEPVGAKPIAQ